MNHNDAQKDDASGNLIGNFSDWQFKRYATMQLLPWFYRLLIFGVTITLLAIVVALYFLSPLAGVIATVMAPLVWLVAIAVIRSALEYLAMAHRMMRVIESMGVLPEQLERLSLHVDGMTSNVNQLIGQVNDMHTTVSTAAPLLRASGMMGRVMKGLRRDSRP